MTEFVGMTPDLQAYLDFDPKSTEDGYVKRNELAKKVDSSLLRRYDRFKIDSLFIPENEEEGNRTRHRSPRGEYELVVSTYNTSPGCWKYCQGVVYKVGQSVPVAIVNRNYHAFPHTFIEDHPNGHSYLVCGENYQGQTVIELDTGKRKDYLPDSSESGCGFCWASHEFHKDSQILVVCGCYWACPYEFKLYDFSDPMSGWDELEADETMYEDDRKPSFEAGGIIKIYQTAFVPESDRSDGEPGPIASVKTYRREGLNLILLDEFVSLKEQERRAREEEYNRKWEESVDNFKSNSPVWLQAVELMKEHPFKSGYLSVGQTFQGWCPTWEGEEKRFCTRIFESHGKNYTFDLEIAELTGPVKLVIYKKGQQSEPAFFEHSVDGVKQAFELARKLLECQ